MKNKAKTSLKNLVWAIVCVACVAWLSIVTTLLVGCSSQLSDETDDVSGLPLKQPEICLQSDFEQTLMQASYNSRGLTSITVHEHGLETAIEKKDGEINIVFLIVNHPGISDTATSLDYLQKTRKIVADKSLVEWYYDCKRFAKNEDLVTDCGMVEWYSGKAYLFTVAYNSVYLRMFYD